MVQRDVGKGPRLTTAESAFSGVINFKAAIVDTFYVENTHKSSSH
jgi:hypothetical protein